MSSIHEALRKAQKERDARSPTYRSILSTGKRRQGVFFERRGWVIALSALLLCLTLYSWLHFRDKKTIVVSKTLQPVAGPRQKNTVRKEHFYERARDLHKQGKVRQAEMLYQRELALKPGNARALNNLAVIYMRQGNYAGARRCLESAIRLKPVYVDPYYNLACLYALQGKVHEGLKNLEKAASLDASVRVWAQGDRDLHNLAGFMTKRLTIFTNKPE